MAAGSWLEALAAHPVLERRDGARVHVDTARRMGLLAARGTDTLAVIDGELRMTSLAAAKRALTGGSDALTYKVCRDDLLGH